MTIPFEAVRERWRTDPAYRAAHAEISEAMDLAFAMGEARLRARLTQAEIAARIGTSQATVARWETGRSAPTTSSLRRFAKATGARLIITLAADERT
ncbi:helix-turn-helix domain-containing protein [Methylobacterium sp. A54F]